MFKLEISVGLMGINASIANMFQDYAEDSNIPVRLKVITRVSDLSQKGLSALVHICDDVEEIKRVLAAKSSLTRYWLQTSVGELLEDEVLDQIDVLSASHMSAKMERFFLRRFVQKVVNAQNAKMTSNCMNSLINMIPDMVWIKDINGCYVSVNSSYAHKVRRSIEDIIGLTHLDVWPVPEGQLSYIKAASLDTDTETIKAGTSKQFKERVWTYNNDVRSLKSYKAPVYNQFGEPVGTVGLAHDTTKEKKYREYIVDMVRKDYLTGLANRRQLYSFMRKNWREGKLTVLFCDLDGFKKVNDTYGHAAGDEALVTVARCLKETLDETMVARVGGDEFLIAYIGNYRLRDIQDKCDGIEFRLQQVLGSNEKFKHMSISIGISSAIFGTLSIDKVVTQSDRAMYEAKKTKGQAGRKCYHVYNEETDGPI